ncbi:DUF4180 domain-containing protein, partial [Serratia marcescens]|uniref:DUF4180 domain-containing protein n=1 Tax=Serratia marcescens TaxID=615 RepID=UPI0034E2CB1F
DAAFFQTRSGMAAAPSRKNSSTHACAWRCWAFSPPPRPAQSHALQDFVREANRGEQVWFLSSLAELEQRLGA